MSSDGVLVLILSSPSGGGKSTLVHRLLKARKDFWHSVSMTTRAPRPGERDGKEYHFVKPPEFHHLVGCGELAEWAEVHGEWYGTPVSHLREHQLSGRNIVLDLDIMGTATMKARWPNILTIYLLPPSREELERRLHKRKSETDESIQRRLKRFDMEQAAAERYDYRIINDDIECAFSELLQYIQDWQPRVVF